MTEERKAVSDFDKWYDNHEWTVHETEESMFREYSRQSWHAAREATIEECAKVCDEYAAQNTGDEAEIFEWAAELIRAMKASKPSSQE